MKILYLSPPKANKKIRSSTITSIIYYCPGGTSNQYKESREKNTIEIKMGKRK